MAAKTEGSNDVNEVLERLARFARVLDRKEWDAVGSVFADDVVFDYGAGGQQRGIEALRHTFRRFLDVCGNTQHLIGSIIVNVDGDHAESHSYVQARHVGKAAKTGAIFDSNGEYHDRWQRTPQGWRIVERRVDWLMHSGDPAVISADSNDLH